MNKKSYLLPHACQKAGWWMLLASVVCLLILLALDVAGVRLNWGYAGPIMGILSTFLPLFSLMLVCISQEKEEDEYIQSLRARAVFIVVVYTFIINMISDSLSHTLIHTLPFVTYGTLREIIYACTNVPLMAVIYLVIFKGTLLINQIKSRHDRQ